LYPLTPKGCNGCRKNFDRHQTPEGWDSKSISHSDISPFGLDRHSFFSIVFHVVSINPEGV